mgnify:CR=1 FL=1
MKYVKIVEQIVKGSISQQDLFENPESLLSQMGYEKEEIMELLDILNNVKKEASKILTKTEIFNERSVLYCSVGF